MKTPTALFVLLLANSAFLLCSSAATSNDTLSLLDKTTPAATFYGYEITAYSAFRYFALILITVSLVYNNIVAAIYLLPLSLLVLHNWNTVVEAFSRVFRAGSSAQAWCEASADFSAQARNDTSRHSSPQVGNMISFNSSAQTRGSASSNSPAQLESGVSTNPGASPFPLAAVLVGLVVFLGIVVLAGYFIRKRYYKKPTLDENNF